MARIQVRKFSHVSLDKNWKHALRAVIYHDFRYSIRLYWLGVTKQVGDALLLEGQQRTGRVVSIGIAPWGIVERNHELLGHNRDVPCHSISSPRFVVCTSIQYGFSHPPRIHPPPISHLNKNK